MKTKIGWFEKFKIGWNLAKIAFKILRKNKELLLYPILTFCSIVFILTMFLGLFIFYTANFFAMNPAIGFIFSILTVVIPIAIFISFVAYYFSSALIAQTVLRLKGKTSTLNKGFNVANDKIDKIFKWSLISAVVLVIIGFISHASRRRGIRGLGLFLGLGWSLATLFIVPVLIYEKLSTWESLKRSALLFKGHWKETIGGGLPIQLAFLPFYLAGLALIVYGAISWLNQFGGIVPIINPFLLILAGILVMILAGIVTSALKQILAAGLYLYVTKRELPKDFDKRIVARFFR